MGKILVCDDSKLILELIKDILEEEGHKVITASSGKECIQKAKETKPDFIFLDLIMEGMDGWETLKKLKENQELKDIKVSMLTAKHLDIDAFQLDNMQDLVAYIHKPIEREELIGVLKEYL